MASLPDPNFAQCIHCFRTRYQAGLPLCCTVTPFWVSSREAESTDDCRVWVWDGSQSQCGSQIACHLTVATLSPRRGCTHSCAQHTKAFTLKPQQPFQLCIKAYTEVRTPSFQHHQLSRTALNPNKRTASCPGSLRRYKKQLRAHRNHAELRAPWRFQVQGSRRFRDLRVGGEGVRGVAWVAEGSRGGRGGLKLTWHLARRGPKNLKISKT